MSLEDAIRDHAAALRDIAAAIRESANGTTTISVVPQPDGGTGATSAPAAPAEEAPGKSRKTKPAAAAAAAPAESSPPSADSPSSSTSSSADTTPTTSTASSDAPSTASRETALAYADIQQPFLKELIAKQGRSAGIDFLKAMGLADGQTLKDLPEARWPEALVELRKRIGS